MGSVNEFDAAHDAYSQITQMDKVRKIRNGTTQCVMDGRVILLTFVLVHCVVGVGFALTSNNVQSR